MGGAPGPSGSQRVRSPYEAPVRVNLANPTELQEFPGIGPEQAAAIVKFRREHGPIQDVSQLARILGGWMVPEALAGLLDFAPADDSAPEAPGA